MIKLKPKMPDAFTKQQGHPIILQYLYNNNITSDVAIRMFLDAELPYNVDPFLLKDVDKATDRIKQAISNNEQIVVFGDYDADGVTSTVLMTSVIKDYGGNVEYVLPSREDGYGIKKSSVDLIMNKFPYASLIITVDNGITAPDAVKYAVDKGLTVIVTDHHSYDKDRFPVSAYAVINPQQPDCDYPEPSISGCTVAYRVCQALAQKMVYRKKKNRQELLDIPEKYIDLVGLSIVADVMPLPSYENRHLLWRGIRKLRTDPNIGVKALCEYGGWTIDHTQITAIDIAFSITAPINAAGRVAHPDQAFDLLSAKTEIDAITAAKQLKRLNETRKYLQKVATDDALASLEDADEDTVIFARVPDDTIEGVIGLVATNVSGAFNKPAMAYRVKTHNVDGVEHKVCIGSARSIDGINIAEALKASHDLIIDDGVGSYGGHAGAAGFMFKYDNLKEIIKSVNNHASKSVTGESGEIVIYADMEYPISRINTHVLDVLSKLEPIGVGGLNQVIFLARNVEAIEVKAWGKQNQHLKFIVSDPYSGSQIPVNGWNMAEQAPDNNSMINVAYRVEKTTWPYEHIRLSLVGWELSTEDIVFEDKPEPEKLEFMVNALKKTYDRKYNPRRIT